MTASGCAEATPGPKCDRLDEGGLEGQSRSRLGQGPRAQDKKLNPGLPRPWPGRAEQSRSRSLQLLCRSWANFLRSRPVVRKQLDCGSRRIHAADSHRLPNPLAVSCARP